MGGVAVALEVLVEMALLLEVAVAIGLDVIVDPGKVAGADTDADFGAPAELEVACAALAAAA